jgi:hypothetical protein
MAEECAECAEIDRAWVLFDGMGKLEAIIIRHAKKTGPRPRQLVHRLISVSEMKHSPDAAELGATINMALIAAPPHGVSIQPSALLGFGRDRADVNGCAIKNHVLPYYSGGVGGSAADFLCVPHAFADAGSMMVPVELTAFTEALVATKQSEPCMVAYEGEFDRKMRGYVRKRVLFAPFLV